MVIDPMSLETTAAVGRGAILTKGRDNMHSYPKLSWLKIHGASIRAQSSAQ